MGGKQAGRMAPPRGLAVESFSAGGEEFLIFSWDRDAPLPPDLTAAERDVLDRIVAGDSNADIARARATSARTVANQVAALLRKTGAESRFDLIRRFAGQRG